MRPGLARWTRQLDLRDSQAARWGPKAVTIFVAARRQKGFPSPAGLGRKARPWERRPDRRTAIPSNQRSHERRPAEILSALELLGLWTISLRTNSSAFDLQIHRPWSASRPELPGGGERSRRRPKGVARAFE